MPSSSMAFSVNHLARQTVRLAALAVSFAILTGCQSLSSVSTSARVRVIDLSPDSPSLDVYQGNDAVAYNLSFGTVTSYIPVTPGFSTLTVAPAGTHQILASTEGSFKANTLYTVLVNSSAASLQQTILTDHLPLPVSAKALPTSSVRLLHQAARTGPVDVYLVPAGQRITSVNPLVTNLAPGVNTGYLNIPACTCAAVTLPAGTVPSPRIAAHIGTQTDYSNGSARTLILLDPQLATANGPQVITTNDLDPLH